MHSALHEASTLIPPLLPNPCPALGHEGADGHERLDRALLWIRNSILGCVSILPSPEKKAPKKAHPQEDPLVGEGSLQMVAPGRVSLEGLRERVAMALEKVICLFVDVERHPEQEGRLSAHSSLIKTIGLLLSNTGVNRKKAKKSRRVDKLAKVKANLISPASQQCSSHNVAPTITHTYGASAI